MKKKLTITIDEDIWDYMEENFTNKSSLVRALLTKYYKEKRINKNKDKENLINKNNILDEVNEVFGDETQV